ncbi:PspC domain-containing protein [Paucibacter sp. KCTC 42545]|uniref:PspC domain-containing protein n=1 Tax=Paucibacter sp. KCTC 42545 TaxID=1768242 RepID=UPI000733B744|nr:PspC domain-containing protein [Paucibacter sp. KCTC 42545]ALT79138.1 hypothetical protein AT984_20045 [Paucibacter sp. KCTC 42545]
MSLATELERLTELHQRGALSDEEFQRAKARLLQDDDPQPAARPQPQQQQQQQQRTSAPGMGGALNALQRSRDDRWLGGVCGGLAQVSGLASWLWRLIFVGLVSCHGFGVLAYLLLWLLVPVEKPPLLQLGWQDPKAQ